jgi:hypothetical protein
MPELRERAAAMLERVTLESIHHLCAAAAADVRRALGAALLHRDGRVADDHDPRLLHPARTILILLSDTSCRNPAVLAAAAFVDSVDAGLAPAAAAAEAVLGGDAAALLCSVPLPGVPGGEDALLERLVCAEPDAALIAVAERLDHARHLHLRPELPWRELHAQVQDAYAPAAARLCPPLARRLERWAEAFRARRLLL